MNLNYLKHYLFILFTIIFIGCHNTNSQVLLQENKSYLKFECISKNPYYVTINNNISFTINQNNCQDLFQIPIGKNRVSIINHLGKQIILRDIFTSNGTTTNIELR